MAEDFKAYSLRIFQEIHFNKENLGQLGVEALKILDVLRRSSMEREELERLREVAMMAVGLDKHQELFPKLEPSRRCKW